MFLITGQQRDTQKNVGSQTSQKKAFESFECNYANNYYGDCVCIVKTRI